MKFPRWLTDPRLSVAVRIGLGGIFLVAALSKIADPPTFAHMVYNYRLVPGPAINAVALVLPWLELFAGAGLLLGVWRNTGASVITVLLLIFLAGMSINIARGNAVDCGCFGALESGTKTHAQLMSELKWDVLRDIGILLLAGQVLLAERTTESRRTRR